ncbi:glycoside hydrolase family 31 protein [Piromyces sp. E2]|nr:glycoside hydrolase family 31 protein [Piromyces sp. E2]|eukprot:OUM57717.1 glycoside hydrolase family 31 protein [Piromyces sp. E2]
MCVKKEDFKRCDQSGFCTRQRAYGDLVDKTNTGNASPYKVIPDSVELNKKEGYITAKVLKTAENTLPDSKPIEVKFNLRLDLLKSGSVRMHFEEAEDTLKSRFDVSSFALENNKPENAKKIDSKTDKDTISFTFGENNDLTTLVLTYNPLKIELVKDGEVALAFNQNGYFNFEEHRSKETPKPEEQQNEEAQDANQNDNQDDQQNANQGNEAAPENENAEATPEISEEERLKQEEIKNLIENTQKNMWSESFKSNTDSKPFGPESIGFDVAFLGYKNVYGIPQHTSPLSLKTTRNTGEYSEPYRLYNLDVFEYIVDSPMAIYGSIPFMLAHKKNQSAGFLFINASEMWIDVNKDETSTYTHWMAESGKLDIIFFVGKTPKDVIKKYMDITGKPALPQLFAIAYHQCRWNYNDEEDVLTVDSKFDEHGIPYDVIWLDIEHTDGKRYFTWDYSKFPDPIGLQDKIALKDDEKTFEMQDQHMVGESLLVKPITDKDQKEITVYLPTVSNWYNYMTKEAVKPDNNGNLTMKTDLRTIPVFIRGGSIIPQRLRHRRSSRAMKHDPYTLLIALDNKVKKKKKKKKKINL